MPTCKACGEEIGFIQTPRGKYLPVDAESYGQHALTPGVVIVTEAGEVLRGGQDGRSVAYGYVPHWSTCTHPDQFRKERS